MPERKSYASGTPNWVDLQTTDQAAAKQFYGELFGWTLRRPSGRRDQRRLLFDGDARTARNVAAIAPLGDQAAAGVPPHWNSYVSVDDVDATTAKVEPAGGTVIAPPFDVIDAGRMSVVQDPTGAIFELVAGEEQHRRAGS